MSSESADPQQRDEYLSCCFVLKIWLPHDRQPEMPAKTGQETEENREDGKQKGSFQGN